MLTLSRGERPAPFCGRMTNTADNVGRVEGGRTGRVSAEPDRHLCHPDTRMGTGAKGNGMAQPHAPRALGRSGALRILRRAWRPLSARQGEFTVITCVAAEHDDEANRGWRPAGSSTDEPRA